MIESLSPVVKVLEKEYSDEFVNGLLLTSYLPKERKSSLERLLINQSVNSMRTIAYSSGTISSRPYPITGAAVDSLYTDHTLAIKAHRPFPAFCFCPHLPRPSSRADPYVGRSPRADQVPVRKPLSCPYPNY